MRRQDLEADERAALRLVPITREIMDEIREKLPEGTHFGVMILVPGKPEGRVVAMTTDRDVVAPAVAQWVLEVLGPKTGDAR
jgi:hypothetical protein